MFCDNQYALDWEIYLQFSGNFLAIVGNKMGFSPLGTHQRSASLKEGKKKKHASWEMEKMLDASFFSFSQNASNPIRLLTTLKKKPLKTLWV